MGCEGCCNWKCGALTYAELEESWGLSIGGDVTPGHYRRYQREARRNPIENIRIGLKYCSKGVLTRFYLQKNEKDRKPTIIIKNCLKFQEASEGTSDVTIKIPSPLWSTCTTESHGPTKVKGIPFTTGIYERGIYFRVPMCGKIRPKVSKKKITVTLSFDSNAEYLRWWGKLYPRSFKRLNK